MRWSQRARTTLASVTLVMAALRRRESRSRFAHGRRGRGTDQGARQSVLRDDARRRSRPRRAGRREAERPGGAATSLQDTAGQASTLESLIAEAPGLLRRSTRSTGTNLAPAALASAAGHARGEHRLAGRRRGGPRARSSHRDLHRHRQRRRRARGRRRHGALRRSRRARRRDRRHPGRRGAAARDARFKLGAQRSLRGHAHGGGRLRAVQARLAAGDLLREDPDLEASSPSTTTWRWASPRPPAGSAARSRSSASTGSRGARGGAARRDVGDRRAVPVRDRPARRRGMRRRLRGKELPARVDAPVQVVTVDNVERAETVPASGRDVRRSADRAPGHLSRPRRTLQLAPIGSALAGWHAGSRGSDVRDRGRQRAFLAAARDRLEREGVSVVGVASTGDQALAYAGALRPDVVLVDLDLGTGERLRGRQNARGRSGQVRAARDPHLHLCGEGLLGADRGRSGARVPVEGGAVTGRHRGRAQRASRYVITASTRRWSSSVSRQPSLAEDAVHVLLDRALGDPAAGARSPRSNAPRPSGASTSRSRARERLQRVVAMARGHQLVHERRVDDRAALGDAFDGPMNSSTSVTRRLSR